jgi:hypothetical protein
MMKQRHKMLELIEKHGLDAKLVCSAYAHAEERTNGDGTIKSWSRQRVADGLVDIDILPHSVDALAQRKTRQKRYSAAWL